MKILIVEDQPTVATLLRRHLSVVASDILLADSLEAARLITRTVNPLDLISIDLRMPGSDMPEILEYLREIRQIQPDAVVVVLSGYIERCDETPLMDAGADGIIPKEAVPTRTMLIARLASIIRLILSSPPRFKRQLAVAELMAQKFSDYLRSQSDEHASGSLRASLA